MPNPDQNTAPVLTDSARSISKATLVPLNVPVLNEGGAIVKSGYAQQLLLQHGEVDAVRRNIAAYADTSRQRPHLSTTNPIWALLTSFEGRPMPAFLPPASEFADIPVSSLQTFGRAVAALRKQAVDVALQELDSKRGALIKQIETNWKHAGAVHDAPYRRRSNSGFREAPSVKQNDLGMAQHMLNLALAANRHLAIELPLSRSG